MAENVTRRTMMQGGAVLLGTISAGTRAKSGEAETPPRLGPRYAPDYALAPYDTSGSGIPHNALDASDFGSLAQWLDALAERRLPGKIASGVYDGSSVGRRRLVTSIYGYGATRPIIHSGTAPCILYFSADNVTVQYLRFETAHLALAYVDRGQRLMVTNDWRSADLEGSERDGSRALEYDSDIKGIRVLDCEFSCALPIAFFSEYHFLSDIHIARNKGLHGCSGFACIRSDRFEKIYVYQNDIADLEQTGRGNHVGTVIWVGSSIDNSPNFPRNRGVFVENNRIENVTAAGADRDYNSGVAIDVRESFEAVIRHNVIRNVVNVVGHVDSNAVYAKSNVLLEHNHIENCGASAEGRRSGEAGSEGSLVTFKGGSRCHSVLRGNTFVAGTRTDVPMLLITHTARIEHNRFEGWRYSGNHMYRDAMIRSYSGGPISIVSPALSNCGTAARNPHKGYLAAGTVYEGGNVSAQDLSISFDGERTDVFQGDVAIVNCFTQQGERLSTGYEPETEEVILAAEAPLSQRQRVIMNALVRDLKYSEIWNELAAFYLLHAPDARMAGVDWRTPSRTLNATRGARFSAFSGYVVSQPGGGLDTNFNPVAESLAAEDCMMAIGLSGDNNRSDQPVCGNGRFNLVVRSASPPDTVIASVASDSAVSVQGAPAPALGLHALQRSLEDSIDYFAAGRHSGSAKSSSSEHEGSTLSLLASSDGQQPAPYSIWAFAVGRSLNREQHGALNEALSRYRSSFTAR